MSQQPNRIPQQDQPFDNAHKLTKQVGNALKQVSQRSNHPASFGNPKHEPRRSRLRHFRAPTPNGLPALRSAQQRPAATDPDDGPVTIGEAVQLAGILGVPLMELVTARGAETEQERQHADRIAAQIAVRSLIHEAAERDRLLREQTLMYEDVLARLQAARLRLRELGGEVPWDTPGVPPGLQPEVFDVVRRQILQMGEETRSRVIGRPKFDQTN
jgi:hypothetical protein